eukprot:6673112-Alexandrium_andersonii.AAC.1
MEQVASAGSVLGGGGAGGRRASRAADKRAATPAFLVAPTAPSLQSPIGSVAQRDPQLAHWAKRVMPTASSHAPNSRNGPGGTPARIRAGNNREVRCSRTERDAGT